MTKQTFQVYETELDDFRKMGKNPNRGTERGAEILDASLDGVGMGRSVVSDRHGEMAAGSQTLAAAARAGIERVIVVESEGDALIVHKRTDWDLTEPGPDNPARLYAVLDNRAGEEGLDLDPDILEEMIADGVDISSGFTDDELAAALGDDALIGGTDMSNPRSDQNIGRIDKKNTKRIRLECGEIMVAIDWPLYDRLYQYCTREEQLSISDALMRVLATGLEMVE